MARYTGPQTKIARRFGEPLFGPDKYLERRNYPPGLHGKMKKRKKLSVYGVQLNEKQKAKFIYGVLEKQFRNAFKKAARKEGITGELLLQILESRLDNVVFRMGIAPTRRASRQLVGHKHILINGEVCNIPSYEVKLGDIVSVRERSKSLEIITDTITRGIAGKYSWIEWDNSLMSGKMLNRPSREEIPENINEQLIVELYSK
ncbi:MAG: 30S ribosomal protein S4 [Bacteroidales bacterium]|nr:30S ribosomal protein S4 [Bacteroidales bacterium]